MTEDGSAPVPGPSQKIPDELRVLLLAPTGRDAPLLSELLKDEGIPCSVADGPDELFRELGPELDAGLVILAEEAVGGDDVGALATLLVAQPPWSDLPVFVLAHPNSTLPSTSVLLERRSTDLLRRPMQPEGFLTAVHSALKLRRRQYELRDLLSDTEQLSERLRERATQLRRLSLQLADAEERERRRLAVYVHDDLQQILAGTMFHLDVTERKLDDPPSARKGLARVRGLLSEAIEGSRSLSQELSPTALRRSGLVGAVKWLAEHVEALHGLKVDVDVAVTEEPTEQSVVVFVFRAAQELLLNVVKHAETRRAEVALRGDDGQIELEVRDHGKGFDPSAGYEEDGSESFGLFNIGERAELLGGKMEIESAPAVGSRVRLRVPCPRPSAAGPTPEQPAGPVTTSPERTPEGHPSVRVVLVDDHAVVRRGLRLVLDEHPDIIVVGELDGGREAVEAADSEHPDIMLMDVAMPGMDGIEATRKIKEGHPEIRIIGLSMFDDADTAQEMIDAGAELYLSKAGPSEQLITAILSP